MSKRRAGFSVAELLSLILCAHLLLSAIPPPLLAQTAEAPTKLNIVILESEGAVNNVRQRTAREAIVQVEDQNHKPIGGVAVVFLAPNSGAGGSFAGSQSLTVVTDSQGRAVARGFQPNRATGKYQIRVSASFQGLTASAAINMANVVPAAAAAGGIGATKLLVILAVAGAAAAGGVVAATRGGGGGAAAVRQPTVIMPGTGVVGAP